MFKNMKLGAKLTGSFSGVAALTLILGALAVFSMWSVKTVAVVLSQEKIPAVSLANQVERDSLATMYEVRGYAYTEESQFLDKGREQLASVKSDIKKARDHADKYRPPVPDVRASPARLFEDLVPPMLH